MNFKIASSAKTEQWPPRNDGRVNRDDAGLLSCNDSRGWPRNDDVPVIASAAKRREATRDEIGSKLFRLLIALTIINCMALLSCIVPPSFARRDPADDGWAEYKSDHFIVYHHPDIPSKYVRDFTRMCEKYYDRITYRLGFNRFNFWLWENRARLFVFGDKSSYVTSTSSPSWTDAAVHMESKHIATYYMPSKDDEANRFNNIILPHELTHIILREFIGMDAKVPLWFDEGTASSSEVDSDERYIYYALEIAKQGKYIPVSTLERLNHRSMDPMVFYPLAAALVNFLLEEKGSRADFVALCREIRDGTPFYEAMRKVYKLENSVELNNAFVKHLERGG